MKIYTRTGDDGSTGLFGGQRVRKDDPRIDCYGTIDELNAAIGHAAIVAPVPIVDALHQIQNELFVLGSHLATPETSPSAASLPHFDEACISRLEMEMDSATDQLPALRNFILPGGVESAGRLHIARTICRRAERLLVAFAQDRPVPHVFLIYLNRLSDWFFVQARLANHLAGACDTPWVKT